MMICSSDGKIFQLPSLILQWSWTVIKTLLETLNLTLWFHFFDILKFVKVNTIQIYVNTICVKRILIFLS